MPTPTSHTRRAYLAAAGAAALTLTAGCTSLLGGDGYDHVVLEPPEHYEMLRESRDGGDLARPVYGDEVPDVGAPCTVTGEEVRTTDFAGERHALYTFIFARCHAACPTLTASLRHVQDDSVDGDYVDDVALCNVTFDPEHDTPDVLESYGDGLGVDYDLGNWHFLRPETEADAHEVVSEAFGCYFERNEDYEEGNGHGDHGEHHGDGHGDDHDHGGNDDTDAGGAGGGHSDMAFAHASMIVLVNAGGYVERTYTGMDLPTPAALIEDVRTVVDGWEP
ncbi:SCO family protein [Natronobiforma cellulositropha]|uniref:SCO family protein n=1 Tax=Natronobiforma cellulositropha TaxID=1679076 RepID=UPI0021D5AEE3|nr:SCO family protein [Natronobiforma cellulositropha]